MLMSGILLPKLNGDNLPFRDWKPSDPTRDCKREHLDNMRLASVSDTQERTGLRLAGKDYRCGQANGP